MNVRNPIATLIYNGIILWFVFSCLSPVRAIICGIALSKLCGILYDASLEIYERRK